MIACLIRHVCWLLVLAIPVAAQQGTYIRLREPTEWASGKPVSVRAGQRLHVSGVAWDSGGVRQVLVNGAAARIERDGDVWSFSADVQVTATSTRVVIAVVPTSGPRFSEDYEMTVSAAPPIAERAADPVSAAPPRSSRKGFRMRAFGYAGGVVAGVVLATMKSSTTSVVCRPVGGGQDCFNHVETKAKMSGVGLGVAALSALAGVVDYAMSSHGNASRSAETHGLRLRQTVGTELPSSSTPAGKFVVAP